jgi:hypothetical protein
MTPADEILREDVKKYLRAKASKGKSPSLEEIKKKFKMSNNKFYALFPERMAQAYLEAGCQPPVERIERMKLVASRSVPTVNSDAKSQRRGGLPQ